MNQFFSWFHTALQRLRALFTSRRLDSEFDQELETHISLLTEENARRGMSPKEARDAALRSFGGVTQAKEDNREHRGFSRLESWLRDLRYAFQALRKNRGFSAVAVTTLALGIGANTAIFQLLDAVRICSLPVKNPNELVEIKLANTEGRRGGVNRFGQITNPLWQELRTHHDAFAGMLAWGETEFNLASGGESRYAHAILVSGDFFNVLGVAPTLGRVFTPADDQKGCGASAAVISHAFWQREFGGNPRVIGTKLSLDSHPVEIVGVTPPSFFGFEIGRSYDVAVPLCAEEALRGENSRLANGTSWWLVVVARLKPGSTINDASALLGSISSGTFQATLPANYPPESIKNYLGFRLIASPAGSGISQVRNDYTDSLWILLGASGLILLIACANLANIMLARGAARQREIGVRLALGASRARLLRQLMTESLLLSIVSATVGLWLARVLSQFMVSFLAGSGDPVFLDLRSDWRVLGFNAGLAILACVLFGLTAALRATACEPTIALKTASRTTAGREWFGMQRILVVAQVALSLALTAGALLFGRSLRNLVTQDAGFRQAGILLASLDFTRLNVATEQRITFAQRLLEHVQAIPGIQAAASADIIPLQGESWSNGVWMDGSDSSRRPETLFSRVSPDYFKALGIPFIAGRTFDFRDQATGPKVAIVNEEFVRRLTNGNSPIGKKFWRERTPREQQTLYEIVGVVRNTKYLDLRESFRPIVYLASSQDPLPDLSMQLVMRTDMSLADIRTALKHAMNAVSPQIAIDSDDFKTMIQSSLLRERLMATLSGFFGLLAILLATIGLYGVISYMVARRTAEIGIRMALGASRGNVLRLIMREASTLVLLGLAIGAVLALSLSRVAASLLYGLSASDPLSSFAAALLLAIVALAASHLPARRASRLDPLQALREE